MNAPAVRQFDVVGIGNAIVDVLATVHADFIAQQELVKGSMTLIDAARATRLYAALGPAVESSGGSAGNTIAGLASLGAHCAFLGKVGNDPLGDIFEHDLRSLGVHCPAARERSAAPTARCLVMVTPDAQRTMATFLGAAAEFGPGDLIEAVIRNSAITYLEGYLFDRPNAKQAFRRAQQVARAAGRKVALTLSDSFCVNRHKDDFLSFIADGLDVLFANEAEMQALLGATDSVSVREAIAANGTLIALTRSERGSSIISARELHDVPATQVGTLLDTTGAGDLYASGFLFGLSCGAALPRCGELGSLCAAEVISHLGARPESSLRALAAARGVYPSD